MAVAENTITEMTATEIVARRDMEKQRFVLWQTCIAASCLYTAMLNKPSLYEMDETDAQYETCRKLKDSYNALDAEYSRLYRASDVTGLDN